MRIGIVSGEYPPHVGGVGDQAARLARELIARGHTVPGGDHLLLRSAYLSGAAR